ncbi:MAG: hypothetical protein ACTHNU_15270 [Gaiellales bacterium]
MNSPAIRLSPDVSAEDVDRIRTACSHVVVPREPAASGYRYYDLGGGAAPFYLRRLSAGPIVGALTLSAPIEFSTGDEAEPGARALARAAVSIGMTSIAWTRLANQDLCGGVWADLTRQAVEELSQLDLLEPDDCPICSADAADDELEAAA